MELPLMKIWDYFFSSRFIKLLYLYDSNEQL